MPKAITHDAGKLTGVTFEKVAAQFDAKGRRQLLPTGEPDLHFPCDDVLVAIGQENGFPWIERDIGVAKYFSFIVIKSPIQKLHYPLAKLFNSER
mgnify:CR=1 FL=1